MTEIMSKIISECYERRITQKELALMTGITEASISRYFKDIRTPNIKNAEKMCNALGFTLIMARK